MAKDAAREAKDAAETAAAEAAKTAPTPTVLVVEVLLWEF
jgi:hypothetical protein